MLHGADGKKLSKRHGAASVQELRAAGYLPAAVRNYLALLGWGSGDDATVLSTEELIERFELSRVSRNPARFDEIKLRWLDGIYIRKLAVPDLTERLLEFLRISDPQAALSPKRPGTVARSCGDQPGEDPDTRRLLAARGFFFVGEPPRTAPTSAGSARQDSLSWEKRVLSYLPPASFDVGGFEEVLAGVIERRSLKPREVYQPLRVAIAGTTISPGIFESVALLGREETLRRIDIAIGRLRRRGAPGVSSSSTIVATAADRTPDE